MSRALCKVKKRRWQKLSISRTDKANNKGKHVRIPIPIVVNNSSLSSLLVKRNWSYVVVTVTWVYRRRTLTSHLSLSYQKSEHRTLMSNLTRRLLWPSTSPSMTPWTLSYIWRTSMHALGIQSISGNLSNRSQLVLSLATIAAVYKLGSNSGQWFQADNGRPMIKSDLRQPMFSVVPKSFRLLLKATLPQTQTCLLLRSNNKLRLSHKLH